MLFSLACFAVVLTLASSILGAVIPITTAITSSTASALTPGTLEPSHRSKGPIGALFKNSVHDKVYLSEVPAATPTAKAVNPTMPALPRRSGELWRGKEHEEISTSAV